MRRLRAFGGVSLRGRSRRQTTASACWGYALRADEQGLEAQATLFQADVPLLTKNYMVKQLDL
jgi:hypothetical protein